MPTKREGYVPDWETPQADAAEQRIPAHDASGSDDTADGQEALTTLHDRPPLEDVNEADAAEQQVDVPSGDDDYR